MSRPFKIEIAESEEELKKRLQTANLGNQKEKLIMLWWLKSGQVKEQQEIGKRLARDSSTVTRWLQKYRTDGLSGLLEIKKAPGAKRKIDDAAIAALEEELKTGKGFSSYGAIVEFFPSLQDLRDRIQQLFEQLTFEQVMSISSYNFILEALFYAASY
jgi:transposase